MQSGLVVGVDFSDGSAGAVREAKRLAASLGCGVEAVHVEEGGVDWRKRAGVEAWLSTTGLTAAEIRVRRGLPWVELIRCASERKAVLVVVGSHGRSGFHPMGLGRTAVRLGVASTIPVLLVRAARSSAAGGPGTESVEARGPEGVRLATSRVSQGQTGETRAMSRWTRWVAAMFGIALVAGACSKKPAPEAPAPVATPTRPVTNGGGNTGDSRDAEAARLAEMARNRATLEDRVYFAYDRSDLNDASQTVLRAKVGVLRSDPTIRLRIEGHADERGSVEYNLALGMRRANAAREFLAGFGLDASRFEVASFGEDRPVDRGHTEAAWAKNRRDEFVITAGTLVGR